MTKIRRPIESSGLSRTTNWFCGRVGNASEDRGNLILVAALVRYNPFYKISFERVSFVRP